MPPELTTDCLRQPAQDLVEGHDDPYGSLRGDTLSILDAALCAVMPDRLLRDALEEDGTLTVGDDTVGLGDGTGVHVLIAGKASQGFAKVAHDRLPEARGMVVDEVEGSAGDWDWYVAGHPIPDKSSVIAGKAALEFVEGVGPDETLLVLLSGGASSLMEVPAVDLDDVSMVTNMLLARGVTVHELNTVRKHLSDIKGGQLGELCDGELVTLGICDVPDESATDLGSGPTVADPTTFSEAWSILERIGPDNFPPAVVDHIRSGAHGKLDETPKPDEERVPGTFRFLATNADALEAAESRARELGYRPKILPSPLQGEARIQGESLAQRLVHEGSPGTALLAGGETTVTLRPYHKGGPGVGGRNQELALAAALHLGDAPVVACGFGTDGIDGPTDAAGAIADGRTLTRGMGAKRDAREHLAANDAYPYFASIGDLIRTGPTGTNVMDLFVGLVAEEPL